MHWKIFKIQTWASFSFHLMQQRCCASCCCCSPHLPERRRRRRSSTTSWNERRVWKLLETINCPPYIRHQLASLWVLNPVETSQDGLALLLHQSVYNRLDCPHWGVVRLNNGECKYSVKYNLGKPAASNMSQDRRRGMSEDLPAVERRPCLLQARKVGRVSPGSKSTWKIWLKKRQ